MPVPLEVMSSDVARVRLICSGVSEAQCGSTLSQKLGLLTVLTVAVDCSCLSFCSCSTKASMKHGQHEVPLARTWVEEAQDCVQNPGRCVLSLPHSSRSGSGSFSPFQLGAGAVQHRGAKVGWS